MTELTGSKSRYPPPPVDRISGAPSSGPPSGRFSFPPGVPAPPPDPTILEAVGLRLGGFLNHLGRISTMFAQATGAMLRRPLELRAVVYQMESLGVRSVGIASVTAVFIGMVMAVQFAFGLQKF